MNSVAEHKRNIEKQMRDMSQNGGGAALKTIWAGVRRHSDGTLRPCVVCLSDLMTPDTGEDLPPIIFQSDHPIPAFAIKDAAYIEDLQRELKGAKL